MTPVEWAYLAGGLAYSALEYWLGKTDKVKAGSALEVLITVARFAIRRK